MDWLWDSSKNGSSSNSDPLKDLDPSLREFLEKESPVKYKTAEPSPPKSAPPEVPAQSIPEKNATDRNTPAVPRQSLYPDGRYAHLWSTYKPLRDIEDGTKSDQEKLLDILEGFKERKAQIGRAAVENCAMEQWAVNDCFQKGGWKARMTMCSAETREFERCYNVQSRFLKALGYLSSYERPPEVDEEIQMHADTLYHRMLDQERAVEEAKAAGLPVPTFPSIISSSTLQAQSRTQSKLAEDSSEKPSLLSEIEALKPHIKEQLKDRLEKLSPEEREVEQKALQMEIAAGENVGHQLNKVFEEQDKARKLRKEQGKETFGDKISRLFKW